MLCPTETTLRLALKRALDHVGEGVEIDGRYLIGDTPSDIAAAQAMEAVSIAVATGAVSAEELQDAGADYVMEDLTDCTGLLNLLRGSRI